MSTDRRTADATGPRRPAVRTKRHRLSEDVADAIKDRLIADGLKPGDRLPTEPELVEHYDVSRTVIREASRILVERGLVDIRPGRGMVVADFDGTSMSRQYELMLELMQGSFRHLMEMRLVLEIGMTEYAAARHTPADARRIRMAIESFAASGDSHEAALESDLEFHTAIAFASHNPFFIHIVNPVNDYLRKAYQPSLGYQAARGQTLAEHTAIAEAIFERDTKKAGRLARRHLIRILETSSELVPDVEDARGTSTDPGEQ